MKPTVDDQTKTGLADNVRLAAISTINDLLPLWLDEPTQELKRVVRPTGATSSEIRLEAYKGARASSSFQRKVGGHPSLQRLEKVIQENQPELLGYVSLSGRVQQVGDVAALTTHWCRIVADKIDDKTTADAEITRLMLDLHRAIYTGLLTQEVKTPLAGLKMPKGVPAIALSPNAQLREMSDKEVSEIGSNDVMSRAWHDIATSPIHAALVLKQNIPFILRKEYSTEPIATRFLKESEAEVTALISALHILKSGAVGIVGSYFSISPDVLPNMGGFSTHSLVQHRFPSMDITEQELHEFEELYAKLKANSRDEVRIAIRRLCDSESRLSPVDSLLDAAIGLEVLLDPGENGELAFRAALNYAFIGLPAQRRVRFDR